ncbi:hypothetical protein RF11_12558 [Thelohanellus kitauei]|uniref:Uncharacterized protein n=1 Tax=Thelohanellus kitauei TaxID=669202 RepID=A0A0C2MUM0_THEKT|nr:hypothetical protein RF11_12558 [Thelohanellus kitauei]
MALVAKTKKMNEKKSEIRFIGTKRHNPDVSQLSGIDETKYCIPSSKHKIDSKAVPVCDLNKQNRFFQVTYIRGCLSTLLIFYFQAIVPLPNIRILKTLTHNGSLDLSLNVIINVFLESRFFASSLCSINSQMENFVETYFVHQSITELELQPDDMLFYPATYWFLMIYRNKEQSDHVNDRYLGNFLEIVE